MDRGTRCGVKPRTDEPDATQLYGTKRDFKITLLIAHQKLRLKKMCPFIKLWGLIKIRQTKAKKVFFSNQEANSRASDLFPVPIPPIFISMRETSFSLKIKLLIYQTLFSGHIQMDI